MMNKTGFIKYKIFRMKKPIITEGEFCEKIRTGKQKELVKKIKQTGIDVCNLDINWEYISEQDKLRTCFIEFFKDFIDFDRLSKNKHLTINKIRKFKNRLNWNIMSRCYKFKINELKEFSNLLNWQYIFFHQNLTNNNIKKNFTGQMWWLFSNDAIENTIDEEYKRVNDMVIHKNIRNIPDNFSTVFKRKLEEYIRNREHLKQTLKIELIDLLDNFNSSGEIKKLMSIQINICDKNKFGEIMEKEIPTKKKENLNQNNMLNLLDMYDEDSVKNIDTEDKIMKTIFIKKENKIVDNILSFLKNEDIDFESTVLLYNKFN